MSRRELLSLLQTVRDDPADAAALSVVADWLEEHGDEADRARAEFLRLSAVPDRTTAMNEHIKALRVKHEGEWLGPLRSFTDEVAFGALVTLTLPGRDLLGKAIAELRRAEAWAWVGHLRVRVGPGNAAAVAASPLLAHAAALTVEGPPEALAAVFASQHLRAVRRLDLSATRLTADGVAHLAASPHLGGVTELDLSDNPLTDRGLASLAAAASLGAVRRLRLRKVRKGSVKPSPAGIDALFAGTEALPSLTDLDLSENHLNARAAAYIARGPLAEQLEALDLTACRLPPGAVRALVESPRLGRLRTLTLSRNPLGDAGVAALAGSPLVGRSPALRLSGCQVGDAGTRALAVSPHAAGVTELQLDRNRIGDAGARAIAEGRWAGLRELRLHLNGIRDDGAAALAAAPALAGLRALTLAYCPIGQAGALALARSPHLRSLEHLWLSDAPSIRDEAAVAALRERFGARLHLGAG